MNNVECVLCPRHCKIAEGKRGDCRVRTNVNGKLFSLVYGTPCAAHIDPIEKKPFFHILPGSRSFSIATAGCNLHCLYCQNWEISQSSPEDTRNVQMPPEEVVKQALANQCRSIAYTYSDPVVFYEYMLDTCRIAKDKGLLNTPVTAGYIETQPLKELAAVLHAAKIDLKGITEEFYRKMSKVSLAPVLRTITTLKELGVWVEITNLIIPTWNDSDQDLLTLIRWVKANCGKDTPIHFSRFWPMHKLNNLPPTPESTINRAWEMAKAEGLHYAYVGNIPGHPGDNTICPSCGNVVIKRHGFQILQNNITKGSCSFCQQKLPGIWE